MPKETHLAARNQNGDALLYHSSSYPSPQIIDQFEHYYPGAAKELLEMVKADQQNTFILNNRASLLEFWTRLCGIIFAFLLTAGLIAIGAILILNSHAVSGCVTLMTGIISIIAIIASGGKGPGAHRK